MGPCGLVTLACGPPTEGCAESGCWGAAPAKRGRIPTKKAMSQRCRAIPCSALLHALRPHPSAGMRHVACLHGGPRHPGQRGRALSLRHLHEGPAHQSADWAQQMKRKPRQRKSNRGVWLRPAAKRELLLTGVAALFGKNRCIFPRQRTFKINSANPMKIKYV